MKIINSSSAKLGFIKVCKHDFNCSFEWKT